MGTTKLIIEGWNTGLKKVSMTKLLQARLGLSLKDAKSVTDRVLDGERVELEIAERELAMALRDELCVLAAIAWIAGEARERS